MQMNGSWHLYRPGEAWQKPERQARVVLHTEAFIAVCFNAPLIELLTEQQVRRLPSLANLGPDAISDGFAAAAAAARLRQRADDPIGVALLDQRVMAGVGNVFKSEVLFLQRLSPFRTVGECSDAQLDGVIQEAHRLLTANRAGGLRRTVPGRDAHRRLWVYGRGGHPCLVCGVPIRVRRQGTDARSTYYCANCQGVD